MIYMLVRSFIPIETPQARVFSTLMAKVFFSTIGILPLIPEFPLLEATFVAFNLSIV